MTAGDVTFAYRELGPKGGVPVVFFVHLAANLDNWDPRIIDPIAQHHHVIAFDNRGLGASTGKVPAPSRRWPTTPTRSSPRWATNRRHLLVLARWHGCPSAWWSSTRAGSQADPHRHRPGGRQGHGQGRRRHLWRHHASRAEPQGPEGVPVLQSQRCRQAGGQGIRRSSRGTHRGSRQEGLRVGVPDPIEGHQAVGSPRRPTCR